MKQELTNRIIDHIFTNLGLTGNVRTALNQDIFKISSTIQYSNFNSESKEDELLEAAIYGAEITINNSKVKLLATELIGVDDFDKEWYLLIKVGDQLTHCCSLIINDSDQQLFNGVIAFLLNKAWIPANATSQASVLIGMELLSDTVIPWEKIKKEELLVNELRSFIDYVQSFTGETELE